MKNRRIEPSLDELEHLKPPLNEGERSFLEYLNNELPLEWEIYVQPPLNGLRPDFVILHPQNGIGVFEVKDWAPNLELWHNSKGRMMLKSPQTGKNCLNSQQPIAQISHYKSEIKNVYCPSMNTDKHFGAIYGGLVFPKWSQSALDELFDKHTREKFTFSKKYPSNMIIGCDLMQSGGISDFLINASKPHGYMSPAIANEMRSWLVESELDREQRYQPRLSPEQLSIITTRTKSGYRRVRGPAGSGKTVCLAGRAAQLHNEGKKVLVLYFNITLGNEIRDVAVSFNKDAKDIEFRNYHKWAKDICSENGFSAEYKAIFANGDAEDVLEEQLPALIDQIVQELSADKGHIPNGLVWDAILVDEGQDLTSKWWETIRQFVAPDGEVVLAADVTQDLYNTAKHWTEEAMEGAGFSGRWAELQQVYRLPKKMHEFANDFAVSFLPATKEKVLVAPDQHELVFEPVYFEWRQLRPEQDVIAETLKAILDCSKIASQSTYLEDIPYADVTFLVRSGKEGRQITEALNRRGFNVKDTFSSGEKSVASRASDRAKKLCFYKGSGQLKGSTIHSYKGLENRAVVVFLPEPQGDADLHAYYVALTRLKASKKGSLLIVVSNWEAAREFGEKWNSLLSSNQRMEVAEAQRDLVRETTVEDKVKVPAEGAVERKIKYEEGVTGVTYDKLFTPYLVGCKKIRLTDPYIKVFHQFKNMLDFIKIVDGARTHTEEIKIDLWTLPTTANDKLSKDDREEKFRQLTEAAKQLNVSFQWEAKPNLHDRELVIDTGWEISLGRGLDIYQRADSLSLEANEQSLRAAKAFVVSYHFDEKLKNA